MYEILKHASILKDNGWKIDLILPNSTINLYKFQNINFNVIILNDSIIYSQYYILVATFYSIIFTSLNYFKAKKRFYLVQSCEIDFFIHVVI